VFSHRAPVPLALQHSLRLRRAAAARRVRSGATRRQKHAALGLSLRPRGLMVVRHQLPFLLLPFVF